jgi:hypothetical protein
MKTMQLLMDLRYYLRAPFAEDNGALALLKNYKEWESGVDDLMKENDRLRDELRIANQRRDEAEVGFLKCMDGERDCAFAWKLEKERGL